MEGRLRGLGIDNGGSNISTMLHADVLYVRPLTHPTPMVLERCFLLHQDLLLPQQLRLLLDDGGVVLDGLRQGLLLALDFGLQ